MQIFAEKKLETYGVLELNANFSECVFLFGCHLCFGFWRFVSLTCVPSAKLQLLPCDVVDIAIMKDKELTVLDLFLVNGCWRWTMSVFYG